MRTFERAGWQQMGQVESHLVTVKEGVRAIPSIPRL
jgi:hypothetical protein